MGVGEAIITITLSHRPNSVTRALSPQHPHRRQHVQDIRHSACARPFSARGCFRDNTIEHTTAFTPFAWQKAAFWFDGCREVTVERNVHADTYAGRTL